MYHNQLQYNTLSTLNFIFTFTSTMKKCFWQKWNTLYMVQPREAPVRFHPSSVVDGPLSVHFSDKATQYVESSARHFICMYAREEVSLALSLAAAAGWPNGAVVQNGPFPTRALCTEGCSAELGQTNKRGASKIEIRNWASSGAPASVRERGWIGEHRLN